MTISYNILADAFGKEFTTNTKFGRRLSFRKIIKECDIVAIILKLGFKVDATYLKNGCEINPIELIGYDKNKRAIYDVTDFFKSNFVHFTSLPNKIKIIK